MGGILKKISVKTVFGAINVRETAVGVEKPVMRVVGNITGAKTGESQYGPWLALKGSFLAVNLETGEEFRSSQCFLPESATDLAFNALQQDGVKSVDIAFDIGVKGTPPGKGQIGYEYTVTPLIAPAKSDPILSLMERISTPKLAAPVSDPVPETAGRGDPEPPKAASKGRK